MARLRRGSDRANYAGRVKLYDTTLRDGMGGSGMSLSVGEKLKVVQALDELGVQFIEAGFPSSIRRKPSSSRSWRR